MSVVEQVETLLKELNPTHLSVIDESDGCGAKIRIEVVSDAFSGKSNLNCHRLVQEKLGAILQTIHAVTISAMSPEKYAAKQAA